MGLASLRPQVGVRVKTNHPPSSSGERRIVIMISVFDAGAEGLLMPTAPWKGLTLRVVSSRRSN
jgi:hypothetical protein